MSVAVKPLEVPSSLDRCDSRATHPRLYVVLNPRSLRASIGDLAANVRALARSRGAEVIEASEPAALAAALERAVAADGAPIAVVAGDGTVQAIADYLARVLEPDRRPTLLVLGGGRTNLIAADLGGRGRVLTKLSAYLDRIASGAPVATQVRHTLVVEQDPAPARHGFFLAGAHLDSIIRTCHAFRESGRTALHTGRLSAPYCLLKLGLGRLAGYSPLPAKPDLQIDAGKIGTLCGSTRLFAASALNHETALVNPFADRGEGALRVIAVSGSARGFWWRLPQILLGRYSSYMSPQAGYLSGRCKRVEVTGLARYTLDGEKFECDPGRPTIVRVGVPLRFVLP